MTSISKSIIATSIGSSITANSFGGSLSRQFLTFGGVNEYGEIPAWSPTGDFEIELEFSTTTTAFDPLLTPAASAGNNGQVFVNGTAGQVLFEVDNGASTIFVQSGTAVNDGKLHSAKLSRVGNDYSVSVDGGIPATQTLSGAIMNFTNVGNVDTNFYPGVIANIRLTDTAGGDNRFYPMSGGRSGSGAYELDRLAAVVNSWNDAPTGVGTGWTDNADNTYTCDGTPNTLLSDNANTIADGDIVTVTYTVEEGATGAVRLLVYGSTLVGLGISRTSPGTYTEAIKVDTATGAGEATGRVTVQNFSSFVGTISNISATVDNAMALNNIVSTDWEQFTQVGADWLGANVITNGTFDTDLSGWTLTVAGQTVEQLGGRFHLATDGTGAGIQQSSLVAGLSYKANLDYEAVSGGLKIQLGADSLPLSTTGAKSNIFSNVTSDVVFLFRDAGAAEGFFDNVSVKRILEAP